MLQYTIDFKKEPNSLLIIILLLIPNGIQSAEQYLFPPDAAVTITRDDNCQT